MTESIGILAALCELAAIYLLGRKSAAGWPCGAVGNALWIAYVAMSHHAYGLIIVCGAALWLNWKGWKAWTSPKSEKSPTN